MLHFFFSESPDIDQREPPTVMRIMDAVDRAAALEGFINGKP